jgi:hypothetical protein
MTELSASVRCAMPLPRAMTVPQLVPEYPRRTPATGGAGISLKREPRAGFTFRLEDEQ